MSSDKQETSIAGQRAALLKLAAKNGYKIVREYVDEGISGDATEKRVAFQQMMQDCRLRQFSVILCWDQDRFGRFDPLEAGFWVKPMRDAGVTLETVAQGVIDWTSFAGRLGYMVGQEAKHGYLRDMSRNIIRGKLDAVKQGQWIAGRAPYGYITEKKRLIIDETAAEIAREIFRRFLDGQSIRGIVSTLNERNVPGPKGSPWCMSTIYKMLKNPTYVGDTVWNRATCGKYHSIQDGQVAPGRKPSPNDESQWIVIDNTHEPIISRGDFDKAAVKLRANKAWTSPDKGKRFPLTGLLFCGHCGSKLSGSTLTNPNGVVYVTYVCGGYRTKGSAFCERKAVPAKLITEILVKEVLDRLQKPELSKAVKAMLVEQSGGDSAKRNLAGAVRRIETLKGRIAQAGDRLMQLDDDMVGVAQERLRALRRELATAEADKKRYQNVGLPAASIDARHRAVMAIFAEVIEQIQSGSPDDIRLGMQRSIARATLYFRRRKTGQTHRCELTKAEIAIQPPEAIVSLV